MSKFRTDILEQAKILRNSMRTATQHLPDEVAVKQPAAFFDIWEPDKDYIQNVKLYHNGQLYNVEQNVTSSSVYPPDGEGVLALYRPINPSHAGTLEDPIPWVYGMDCDEGLYFSFNDKIYLVAEGGTMRPCTWAPDSGIWQWVVIE